MADLGKKILHQSFKDWQKAQPAIKPNHKLHEGDEMSYLRSKDKKCHNKRKEGVSSKRRKPLRFPDVCLDPIMCEHGMVSAEWRDDAKDRKVSWFTKLLRKVGL